MSRGATKRRWVADNKDRVREYNRRAGLKRRYGISAESLDMMLAAEPGCDICGVTLRVKGPLGKDKACVDHDHSSGVLRGLLCNECNSGLGKFVDSVDRLRRAAEYLENRNGQS